VTAHLGVPDLAPAAGLVGAADLRRIDLDASFGGQRAAATAALSLSRQDALQTPWAVERLGEDLRLAAATSAGGGALGHHGRGNLPGSAAVESPCRPGSAMSSDWTLSAALDAAAQAVFDFEG